MTVLVLCLGQNILEDMAWLKPLLEEHQIDAYFSGHVHNLEHNAVKSVDYFISGGSGEHKSSPGNGLEKGGWISSRAGYLSVTLDPLNRQADYTFIGDNSREQYR